MNVDSSATGRAWAPIPPIAGLGWALLGVLAFSFSVPFTRVAVAGLSPLFIGSGRAVVAAGFAALALVDARPRLPRGVQWVRLGVVAGGVVIGFPLLTSFALTTAPADHGAVVIALLPAATAVTAVLRSGERPPLAFWVMAALGAASALGFAFLQRGGVAAPTWSDVLLFGAVAAAAVGYAEGGMLARELGAWQTVSWALVLVAPLMGALATLALLQRPQRGTASEWAAFGYLAAVSMFLGFFAWYRGLAIGPIANVSQVQLVQPVLSIIWATLFLREQLTWLTSLGGVAVILCAGIAVRIRLQPGPPVSASIAASPVRTTADARSPLIRRGRDG